MLLIKKLLLSFLIFSSSTVFSQENKQKSDSLKNNFIQQSKPETVTIYRNLQNDRIATNYQEILEKTNNQLSLWWNPYGLLIAILGVLFTVLAIIATIVIYRQSKEYKGLLKTSLHEHKIALDRLIEEKNSNLKIYQAGLDRSIEEYKEKLGTTLNEASKTQIVEFITRLEEQKEYVESDLLAINHSGWGHKDINVNYLINSTSSFETKISLSQVNQIFAVYIKVVTTENKEYWLGLSGNIKIGHFKTKGEYTIQDIYNTKTVIIGKNIFNFFSEGFPDVTAIPNKVEIIRVRASNVDSKPIAFSFKVV